MRGAGGWGATGAAGRGVVGAGGADGCAEAEIVCGGGGGGATTTAGGGGGATAGREGGAGAGGADAAGATGFSAAGVTIAGRCTGAGGTGAATGGGGADGGAGTAGFAATGTAAGGFGATGGTAGRGGTGGTAAASFFCVIAFSTSPGREMCDRSILVLISSSPRDGLAARAEELCDSAEPRMYARTFSASWSSMELECVFFSVTPTCGSASRMALLLTSSSLARSLIRTLLIRPFCFPALC